ncbi:MAG: hypothetical protein GWO10_16310 [candidate division Zixibacteria bacterium]|nr:hypothetical protein [Gammaproteobacteria bacterium]NIR25696.1 hypothetical protein [Gammaproteobacteria bacterium]NIR65289.1 hypothetical protein [candidate division Zixibacteria bacterium]NIS52333.1 hypothetical protein [Phycisphaerae bacterium]NIX02132.1 hypothetical protein [Phycisphaerae bacterium]
MEYPFLIDTNIVCEHINNDLAGTQFPPGGVINYWNQVREARAFFEKEIKGEEQPPTLGISVTDGVSVGDKAN